MVICKEVKVQLANFFIISPSSYSLWKLRQWTKWFCYHWKQFSNDMLSHPRLLQWYRISVNHGKTTTHSHCLIMKQVQLMPWQSDQWFIVQDMMQDVGVTVTSSCIFLTKNLGMLHYVSAKFIPKLLMVEQR
jgi:hypothetical protein